MLVSEKEGSHGQEKSLPPTTSPPLDEVADRLLAFQHRYEEMATPFEWKFTRDDLARLMRRLSATDAHLPHAA